MERSTAESRLNLANPVLIEIYQQLFECYGPQHWWPGDSPFETMVGAVLTQNTAWANVERAIANLKTAGLLELQAMLQAQPDELAEQIRPAGYFNVKAKRLLSLCDFLAESEGLEQLSDKALRTRLLAVHGIGPETADDILLYAFNRPVFVIDAYTRRLFSRLGLVQADAGYETLRRDFEQALGENAELYNEYHALIVRHAKEICRTKPLCDGCCLQSLCEECGKVESSYWSAN
jgi:endonuclease-3 related protein